MKEFIYKKIQALKNNSFWSNLFKNSFFAVLGEGGASFINFFTVICLIHLIGSDGYGILVLAQTYMTIVDTIINMQSWRGVIKYGEAAKVKNDRESYRGYVKLGTILDVSTAILGFFVCYFLTQFVGNLLNWSDVLITCSKIFSFVIIFHFSGTPTAILRMENKFNWVAIQKIVSSIIKIITVIFFILFYDQISIVNGVILYAVTDIIGNILLIIMAFYMIHKTDGIRNTFKAKLPADTKEFTKFTIWTTLSDVVDIPVQYFDVFIVSYLSIEMVTIYKVFKQLVSLISRVTTPLYQAIYPQFSKLFAYSKTKEGYRVVLKIRNVILVCFLPVLSLVGITSVWWLRLLLGAEFAQYWYVLTIYFIVHTIALSYTTIHPYFVSLGQVYYSFKYVLISNVIYTIVAFLGVKYFGMLGLILSYTVQYSIVIGLKNKRIKKILNDEEEKQNKGINVYVVGGNHHNMLGIIRLLGEKGIHCNAIINGKEKYSFCQKSKYLKSYCFVNSDEEIIDKLLQVNNEEKSFVIPTGDSIALLLDENYSKLKEQFILPSINNKGNQMSKYMDKLYQNKILKDFGLNVVDSQEIILDSFKPNMLKLEYPLILKPQVSAYGSKSDITIVKDEKELLDSLQNFQKLSYEKVLAQNFIEMDYECGLNGCCYENNVVIPAVLRKIRIYPKKRGNVSFGKIIPLANANIDLTPIIDFLKSINYNGLYDIELFVCKDKYYVNEINFRNSGNSYVYSYGGVFIPLLWIYGNLDKKGLMDSIQKEYYFRDEILELMQLKHKEIKFKEFMYGLLKSKVCFVKNAKDIKPYICRMMIIFKHKLGLLKYE